MQSRNGDIQQQIDRVTDPYYWIAWIICLVPFALLGAAAYIVSRIKKATRTIYAAKFQNAAAESEETAQEVVPVAEVPTVKTKMEPASEPLPVSEAEMVAERAFTDWPLFEASEISRIELKRGRVVCRFYRQKGMATGKLIPTVVAAKRALGGSIQLAPVKCDSVEAAIAEIKKQAESILDSVRTAKKPTASKNATMVPAIRPDSKIGPMVGELMQSDEFDDIPIFPPSDCEPVEFERLNDDPFSGLEQGAAGAEAPADVSQRMHRTRSARPAAQVAYQGILQAFGFVDRWVPRDEKDPNGKKKKIEHFRVRLLDEELQTEQDHWGVDLERALKDSGAQLGDRVELAVVGTSPVTVKGKTRMKKVWVLSRI